MRAESRIRSLSRGSCHLPLACLAERHVVSVWVQSRHPHAIRIVLGLRIRELDPARSEYFEVLPKIVRLDKQYAWDGNRRRSRPSVRTPCSARPEEHLGALSLEGNRQESAFGGGIIN